MRRKNVGKIALLGILALLLAAVPFMGACAEEVPPEVAVLEERIAELEVEIEQLKAPPEVIRWMCGNFCEAGTDDFRITGPELCDLIKKLSNGRFIVEPYPAGAIVPNTELFTAVSEGVIEMSFNCPAYYMGIMPVSLFEYGVPLTVPTRTDYRMYIEEFGLLDIVQEAYAEHNLHQVYLGTEPAGLSMISTKPIRTVADLKGLKVRAGGLIGQLMGKAGAAVSYIAGGELFTSLATGVVEAAIYDGSPSTDMLGLQEAAKYWMVPPLQGGSATVSLLVNMDKWNTLPDELKTVLEVATTYVLNGFIDHKAYTADKILERWVTEEGVTLVELPDSERAKLIPYVKELLEELAAQDPKYCARAVEALTEFMEFKGYW